MLHVSLLASITPAASAVMLLYVSSMAMTEGTVFISSGTDYAAMFIFAYAFSFINFWVQQVYKNGVGPIPRIDKIVAYLMSAAIGVAMFYIGDLWCVNSKIATDAILKLGILYSWVSINRYRIYEFKDEMKKGELPILPIPTKHIWECELRFNKFMIKFSTYGLRIFVCWLWIACTATNPDMMKYSVINHLLSAFATIAIVDAVDIITMFVVVKLFEKKAAEQKAKQTLKQFAEEELQEIENKK